MAGMGLWGLLALVAVLVLLGLAVLGGLWVFRRLRDEHTANPAITGDAAENTLRERYAAGEIDDEEYERRLSTPACSSPGLLSDFSRGRYTI